jgi:hypothetical protein
MKFDSVHATFPVQLSSIIEAPGREAAPRPKLEDAARHLLAVPTGMYDADAAFVLAAASAWAYSDADTFSKMMARRGLPENDCVAITLANDALFVDSTAYLVQSRDGRVAVLCFRGTEPRNVIDWLTDASVEAEPFEALGKVHGGFLRGAMALWPDLSALLEGAADGRSIRAVEAEWRSRRSGLATEEEAGGAGFGARHPMEVLYIAGHSLGGALAVLTGALLCSRSESSGLWEKVRGVYTFGQPMVGDQAFARRLEDTLGRSLFRHVYRQDIVPRLPPRVMGRFAHLGREYASSDAGWVYQPQASRQVATAFASSGIGVLAWVKQQVPLLRPLTLPFSWGDHSPMNYLRTSAAPHPGSEFE